MDYLNKLQQKCNIDNKLMNHIEQIFVKLIDFGYITHTQSKKLERKLYNNIDTVLIGDDITLDYKSGYYDSLKKELYIKDISNIESIYLRILYALSTTELSKDNYCVGYSTASLSSSNYKIEHKHFGINRAIVSNLACRLLYTLPTALSIVPTYRSYESDFLGNKINSDNDIYFLEGKILQQLCYTFELSEENLYNHLFIKPRKYLNKFLKKANIENSNELLEILDLISRKYSNYNKLIYLNKELNDTYLEIKKHVLNKDISELEKKENKIHLAIRTALISIHKNDYKNYDEFDTNIESVLAETINNFEDFLIINISKIQNLFVDTLLTFENKFSSIHYAIKLKELEKILLVESPKLKNKLYDVVANSLTSSNQTTGSNLIEKIKFSLVNEIISSDKYSKIYKDMHFKKLLGLPLSQNSHLIALLIDSEFVQLVQISNLDQNIKTIYNNTTSIQLTNLGYLLNNPLNTNDVEKIEKIFTSIKSKGGIYNYINIDNMYLADLEDIKLIIIAQHSKFEAIEIKDNNGTISCHNIKLSDEFNVFSTSNYSNLPIVYDKKENSIKKLISYILLMIS
ncbi:MAG: hypothetical protein RSA08_01630 [Clostridia bacterium]